MIIDKAVRAVQCPDCGMWCLLGTCNGFRLAVSAQPLSLDGYRAALLAGLDVFTLSGTRKLVHVNRDRPGVEHALLTHACRGMNAVRLDEPARGAVRQSPCRWAGGAGKVTGECLRSPQEAAQGVVSCDVCEPPPFDSTNADDQARGLALFRMLLKARVVEVIEHEAEEPTGRRFTTKVCGDH